MERPEGTSNTSWPDRPLRRLATALATSVSLIATPLAAQDQSVSSRLEDLIPDSAVSDPEEWASQGVPEEAARSEDAPPELEPDSPLDELPEMEIAWPDETGLPEIEPLEPEGDIRFAEFESVRRNVETGSVEKLSDELSIAFPSDESLFPQRDDFLERFQSLSTVEQLDADGNSARLAAQAEEDEALLDRLLRIYGYYNGQVIRSVGAIAPGEENADTDPSVRFRILPGTQYSIGAINLGNLADARADYDMLRSSFEIETGDPLLADKIVEERYDLDTALGENGYPFAEIAEPELLIDHDREEGDLTMEVTPGGKYRFGTITTDMPDFMSARHLQDIARFEPGDTYKRSLEFDFRRAILATGLVASVAIEPVEEEAPAEGEPGTVDMRVSMTKARLRTIAGSLGYGSGEGFKAAASWEHRNMFPPEGSLRFRGIAGTREQLLGATFRKNNFHGRDRILTVDAFASTIDYDAYDAQTLSLVGSYERVSTLLFQKPLSWSIGLELIATGERERDANGNLGPRETFYIAALPGYAEIDTSDDLLNPTRGYRLAGRVSPEISSTGGVQSFYVRNQVDASYYRQMSDNVVLAGRARFGSIVGAPRSEIAPSRRLYAGGGGSVRGYGYQAIGPSNSEGDPTGGRSVMEFSLEARIRTGLMDGAVGIVPFIDAGTVGRGATPSFDEIKFGAGIGLRYYTSFGPMRIDVATPINPGPNDSPVAVYVALGQAF
ncbi:translocation and assembly module TamA [Altererythrobacter atlanticus]|uniref:Translocation and assembly module TamA n=2 Tax=Croceibacterium atlanticum TaxID=1267766 RepID=A0A0F7KPK4_9SPHN|nr:BamA/TamA family outer membrane protein [Croceibacterium atlanticum]AKH42418.1 Translocation and assembly module TamA precursor [Croceibacterium atlanticum]MBB5731195.1 translocation and assembly module TamA [Croceibacterium atlanticum]